MIYIFDNLNRNDYGGHLMQMHKQRHEMFIQARGWDLNSFFELEIDQFDSPTATYIAVIDDDRLIASVRLTPTSMNTFIGVNYRENINAPEYPVRFNESTWEMFRLLSVDSDWRSPGGHPAIRLLWVAMLEYLESQQAKHVVAVADTGLLKRIPPVLDWREIGTPSSFDQQSDLGLGSASLVEIAIDKRSNQALRKLLNYTGPTFKRAEQGLTLAPLRVRPEQLYAVILWLEAHPAEIQNARSLFDKAQTDDASLKMFEALVSRAVMWSYQSDPLKTDIPEGTLWH